MKLVETELSHRDYVILCPLQHAHTPVQTIGEFKQNKLGSIVEVISCFITNVKAHVAAGLLHCLPFKYIAFHFIKRVACYSQRKNVYIMFKYTVAGTTIPEQDLHSTIISKCE